jgi:hypothetical protein
MTSDKIPEPMRRVAFGATTLPSLPRQSNASGRQLRSAASPGFSDEVLKVVESGAPVSTEVIAEKTAGKIDTTPLAKRFKNK